ncbi:ribosome biogenesis protein BOP1 homolog [Agrilus planipennis]|uniref:Ribosome biogenesis protein BOP1 homolog n=1 Tax=Agrilus planipennis TaxID=224129 RepID=A0A1W4XB80_AGRPL|nr:ribosome biogenesis protein BOP1 homolog [Agrilus planipennis]
MTRKREKRKPPKSISVVERHTDIDEKNEADEEDENVYFNTIEEEDENSASDSELEDDSDGETEKVLEDFVDEVNSEEYSDSDEHNEDDNLESANDNVNKADSVDESESDNELEEDDSYESEEVSSAPESDSDSDQEEKIKGPLKNKQLKQQSVKVNNKLSKLHQNGKNKFQNENKEFPSGKDEYADGDTSDEEDIRNTIGNIPMKWYDEYRHLGYDWDGNKISKPEQTDTIDNFLRKIEDPDFWRTVKDPQTGQEVVLNENDIELIRRIKEQKIPDVSFDDHAPWIEWFTSEVMQMPLRKFPEHKRSFLPSRDEAKKVSKLVHALKMSWIKSEEERRKEKAKKEPQFYMLWQTDDQSEEMRRIHKHIPPPKRPLPGHAESYNPPPEYLFDSRELKQWNKHKETPWKRKLHFVPQKYDSLRKVPAYSRFIKERFLRCMDLYLCPRAIKMRLQVEPDDLVPKLPSPRDLQPFPTLLAIEYKGHTDMIRTITTDKTGQYLASGSDDCTVKVWEINTGRCLKTFKTDAVVRTIEWCPNEKLPLILVASGRKVILINPNVGDFLQNIKADEILKEKPQSEVIVSDRVKTTVRWDDPTEEEYEKGFRIILSHFKEVTQVTWHGKGDYFASVMPDGQNRSVLVSQLSKRRSQLPFAKSKGLIQCVLFHPSRPFLFVATQRHVRIYDLVKQAMVKKLMSNSHWISFMAVHPGGDNLLVATYDRKMLWFDLDLSTKPYQTLRLHGTAVRAVAYHRKYPLFASGSDDGSMIVSHGMVYNDLLKNPLIVPLKRFQDHTTDNDFGIFAVHFHPLQPWVFSAGSDSTIKLYSN